MKPLTNYPVRVFSTGVVVVTLLSIALFWLRFACRVSLSERMPDDIKDVSIEPSGFLPDDFEKDPNVTRRSRVSATMRSEPLLTLGIIDYSESMSPGGRPSNLFFAEGQDKWAYFDQESGQIICRYTEMAIMPDKDRLHRIVQCYIGPDGISELPEEELGRFIEPIVDRSRFDYSLEWAGLILYDKKLRCFFRIDFKQKTVFQGPALGTDDAREPVQIGQLDKNSLLLQLGWWPPQIMPSVEREDMDMIRPYYMLHGLRLPTVPSSKVGRLLVLDKTGLIDLLDTETLELAGTAGRLPETRTLFGAELPPTPAKMLSYRAEPLFLGVPGLMELITGPDEEAPDEGPVRYAGMIAASLSRDGTALAVALYDQEGRVKGSVHRGSTEWRDAGEVAYFGSPWGPFATIAKYAAESFHPPILSVASYFTASAFEAGAGHRALFLLPNSFIAMKARDNRGHIYERVLPALLLILPSIILATVFACRVAADAGVVGLSRNLRRFWVFGTLAFGLAGYITYRLSRPKIALVTCANCGRPRRPDMDTCHRCGSKWHVPELTPPTWRVLG